MLYGFISKIRRNKSGKKYINVFLRNDAPQKTGQHTERFHFDSASIIQERLIYSVLTTMHGTPKKYSPQTHKHERLICIMNK